MPHQCVKCSKLYADDAPIVIEGCACGAKAFLFIRRDAASRGVKSLREGKYDIDIVRLLAGGRGAVVTLAEGKFSIDLDAVLRRGPNG